MTGMGGVGCIGNYLLVLAIRLSQQAFSFVNTIVYHMA